MKKLIFCLFLFVVIGCKKDTDEIENNHATSYDTSTWVWLNNDTP